MIDCSLMKKRNLTPRALRVGGLFLAAVLGLAAARAEDPKPLYTNNFSQVETGKAPEDFLILDGGWIVKEEGGGKVLELPGAPLDTYGALFGPTTKSDIAVTARVLSTKKGRRFPTFGLGLNGQSGYRLQVAPGKGELELYHGDDLLAHVPFEWKSGEWTLLRLQITHSGAVWKVAGKAWSKGTPEPEQPLITSTEDKEPAPGRSAIWGSPYATTPIQFTDLVVTKLPAQP